MKPTTFLIALLIVISPALAQPPGISDALGHFLSDPCPDTLLVYLGGSRAEVEARMDALDYPKRENMGESGDAFRIEADLPYYVMFLGGREDVLRPEPCQGAIILLQLDRATQAYSLKKTIDKVLKSNWDDYEYSTANKKIVYSRESCSGVQYRAYTGLEGSTLTITFVRKP